MSNSDYHFFKFDINQRYYLNVAANTSESLDYTPANNQIFIVNRAGCDSASNPDTNVSIIWDPGGAQQEIILSSYRDAMHENINKQFTGDGTRVLRILLTNDQSESGYLGGFVQGENLDV